MDNNMIPVDIQDVLQEGSPGYARCQRLKMRAVNAVPHVCAERGRIITRVYRETENEDMYSRRAKAIDAILKEMTLFILPDELIVGHISSMQRSAPLFPEFATHWLEEEIDTFATRSEDKMVVLPDVKRVILEEICPYWKNKTFYDRARSLKNQQIQDYLETSAMFNNFDECGLGHVLIDYEKLLAIGINGIKKQIKAEQETLTVWNKENLQKDRFYRSAYSMCDSVIAFARRYSDLARELADRETDSTRHAELLQISRVCKRVPEFPAESFREALQSFWFLQIILQIYDNGVSVTPGRFDQYMYKYYSADIAKGALTKAEAQELLEAMWVKFIEPVKLYKKDGVKTNAGFPMGQNLTIAGVTPEGVDATNDLSYRCLEAHSHMLLMQPNFSVRLNNRTPQAFIKRVCEVIRKGSGMPQLINDEVYVPAMLGMGIPLAEARDYAPVGCVEITPLNFFGRVSAGYINFAKIMEFALNDGKCRLTGRQVGPLTGEPRQFTTIDEVKQAYRQQMFACLDVSAKLNNMLDMVNEEIMPAPLISLFVGDCIERGADVTAGGQRYTWTTPYGVGLANVADSFITIQKGIFEQGLFTMDKLIDMLNSNFEGDEPLRQYIINKLPKYGNDDPQADAYAKFVADTFFDATEGRECYWGGKFAPAMVPVTAYMPCGRGAGALPDGRKSMEPLADGVSPNYGADRHGPTAVLKSVNVIDHTRCIGGEIFNRKFTPASVSTEAGMKKWLALIRAHIAMGNAHIQFNIVDEKTLIEAQQNPEKHRGLVVRVAGYSAFFTELSPDVQKTIIERTKQEL